jgi:hypothetical protein
VSEVRVFRLWGEAHLRRLAMQVEGIVRGWVGEWAAGAQEFPVCCRGLTAADAHAGAPGRPDGGRAVRALTDAPGNCVLVMGAADAVNPRDWLLRDERDRRPGSGTRSRLGTTLVERCQRQLAVRLLGAEPASDDVIPPGDQQRQVFAGFTCRGSGAVSVRVGNPLTAMEWWIDGSGVARLVGAPAHVVPPVLLVSRRDALRERKVTLEARAGAVVLTVGNFRSAGVGDVLRLPLPCDQPLALRTRSGTDLARGYLGAVGGSRAIQLTP